MARTSQDPAAVNELLAGAFARGATTAEAARAAGVSTSTARRRRDLPEVAERILELVTLTTEAAAIDMAEELNASIRFLAEVRAGQHGARKQLWARVQAATTLANLALRHAPPDDGAQALADRLGEVMRVWSQPPDDD